MAINSNSNTQDAQQLSALLDLDDKALVRIGTLKKLVKVMLRNLPIQGEGTEFWYQSQGVVINAQIPDDEPYPFKIVVTSESDDGVNVAIILGTVNGIVAGGSPLSDVPLGDVIYVEVDADGTVVNGYLAEWTITAVTLGHGNTVPDDDPGPGSMTFYRMIGEISEGGTPFNLVRVPLEIAICDSNAGDGSGVPRWGISG